MAFWVMTSHRIPPTGDSPLALAILLLQCVALIAPPDILVVLVTSWLICVVDVLSNKQAG